MDNYRLELEYDGTDFHGWQIQPGQRTVQGELTRALEGICREKIRVAGAGRTDAGVHATRQVASFQAERALETATLQRGLNALLPADVRVLRVRTVPEGFSARHSAVARCYRYQMLRQSSALWRRFYYELPRPVDVDAMREAAELFLGDQDFTAFAASDAGDRCRCVVGRAEVHANDTAVFFEITANRFLHNMVRRLTGVLVEVGRGRFRPSAVQEILRTRDRSRGGPCLPPHGLFLVDVRYPNVNGAASPRIVDAGAHTP
ncbi:MAG: tRNA pseudouridine(38-40) synthase TruA [Candidatus Krumholzibacteriia bacterium]